MRNLAQLTPPTDLEGAAARSVACALNRILADSFALYVKTKSFHWHVSGPGFHNNHRLFDEQADQILGSTDAMAERVRKIGGKTIKSVAQIAQLRRIEENNSDRLTANDMLSDLHDDNLQIVTHLRELKQLAERANDNATSALVDDWTDEAEERVWFLHASIRPE